MSRATLDGPDGWSRGWVIRGHQCPTRTRRQQGGGGVMLWTGIVVDDLVGPFSVQEGVKLTSHTYCQITQYLESICFKNKTMMIWPPNSPDLNPIENLWSIVEQRVYANGKQYSSKDALWGWG